MYILNDGVYGAFRFVLDEPCMRAPRVVKASDDSESECACYPSTLFGPALDPGDKLCTVSLPELNIGDWLYYKDMGAYSESCSSSFNGFVRPKVHYFVRDECSGRLKEFYDGK